MSLPSRLSVLVRGIQRTRAAGSGICFTQTTTFMADHSVGQGHVAARAWPSPGRDRAAVVPSLRGLAAAADRQLVRVVGDGPHHGAGRSRPSARSPTSTTVETNRRGHATRFAQDAAQRGVEVVVVLGGDGTLNEAANGLAGTDDRAGRAARRLDQRLRPHHRAARTTRSRPPSVVVDALKRDERRAGRARLGERPLLLLPHRHRLRRRRRGAGRAAGVAEALGRPPAVHLVGAARRGCAATTAASPHFGVTFRRRHRRCPTATSRSCLNTNPYTYLGQPAARRCRRPPTSTGASWPITFRTLRADAPILGAVGPGAAGRRPARPSRRVDSSTDLDRACQSTARGAVPVPGRRRLPGRDPPARVPPRARRRSRSSSRSSAVSAGSASARRRGRWCRCRRRPRPPAGASGRGRRPSRRCTATPRRGTRPRAASVTSAVPRVQARDGRGRRASPAALVVVGADHEPRRLQRRAPRAPDRWSPGRTTTPSTRAATRSPRAATAGPAAAASRAAVRSKPALARARS